eukprot:4826962-Amphidinium_carterae.1
MTPSIPCSRAKCAWQGKFWANLGHLFKYLASRLNAVQWAVVGLHSFDQLPTARRDPDNNIPSASQAMHVSVHDTNPFNRTVLERLGRSLRPKHASVNRNCFMCRPTSRSEFAAASRHPYIERVVVAAGLRVAVASWCLSLSREPLGENCAEEELDGIIPNAAKSVAAK